MSHDHPCSACGGGPTRSWGARKVSAPALVDGAVAFVEAEVRRRRCEACGRSYSLPDGACEARAGEALRFMAGCLASQGAERAAEACGVSKKTLVAYVEELAGRALSGPVPETVFLGGSADKDAPVVIGDGGPGHVLDASAGDAFHLGDLLSRRGGSVSLAWMAMPVFRLARDTMPDARLALCSVEVERVLDRIVDGMARGPVRRVAGDASLLRAEVESGWTARSYDRLRDLLPHSGMKKAILLLDFWDDQVRDTLGLAGGSPGAALPKELGGLSPLRLRSLAIVTPGPTMAAMTRTLALAQPGRRAP